VFVERPFIKSNTIEKRDYQINIAEGCLQRSTLVVLPTGLGKTIIALIVIAKVLEKKEGKILFMAPTKPLVEQHASFLKKFLKADAVIFTGEVAPKEREKLWKECDIIVSTPQVIANDLISDRISLSNVSLIIFDEAHRAVGNYAYVFVAEKFKEYGGLSLGMTASPGSDVNKIIDVYSNLNFHGVEIRSEYDPDVVNYVHDVKIKWIHVDIPKQIKIVAKLLRDVLDQQIKELQKHGLLIGRKVVSTRNLLDVQKQIQSKLKSGKTSYFHAATIQAKALKVNHAIELAETQGVSALNNYFERLTVEASTKGSSKASRSLVKEPKIKKAMELSKEMHFEHPKLARIVDVVKNQIKEKRDSRIIVFTHYRDTAELVTNELSKIKDVRPVRFVGQANRGKDKGLRQKEQVEAIQKFKEGIYNVMVATSVAEEGLDIPSTDLVVFYEPVPSEIRTIQRRGRTGRRMAGEVVILITKSSRDEAYYWSSNRKEKRMHRELEILRDELNEKLPFAKLKEREFKTSEKLIKPQEKIEKGQMQITDFSGNEEKKSIIIVDTREFNSDVVRELSRNQITIRSKQLDIGDYILSDRVGVERKRVEDFLQSLTDGRLFQQMKELKSSYIHPILIIEGEELFTRRKISPQAIYGAIASIVADFNVPIVSTKDGKETADLLMAIAKRENSKKRKIGIRGLKGAKSLQERQQFIVEGLPNVSATIAQRLLSHFGSIRGIVGANVEQLCEVKGVGKMIAEGIREVLDSGYYKGKKL
jgi:Fanconi anemia group M protein